MTPRTVVLVLCAAAPAACTIPITSQTVTGAMINAGAMYVVDQWNEDSYRREGFYDYVSDASADTLIDVFVTSVEAANREFLFPGGPAEDPAPDSTAPVVMAGADAWLVGAFDEQARRENDPPRPETFPERQWTPRPRFEIRVDSPIARGDTLVWVVTHRGARQAAFYVVPEAATPDWPARTRVAFRPWNPPADLFLSVPTDHAQRNAVEELHALYVSEIARRLGPDALERTGPGAAP